MSEEDYKIAYENVMIANKMLEKENKQLKKRNQELEDGFKATTDELCEYATKKDEAIEYIKWHYNLGTEEETSFCILRDNLLEILGDKE